LNYVKLIAKNELENHLLVFDYQLCDRVVGGLVDEAGHGSVLKVLQSVSQVNGLNRVGVIDGHSRAEFDLVLQEISEACYCR
jgi:predicted GTPase